MLFNNAHAIYNLVKQKQLVERVCKLDKLTARTLAESLEISPKTLRAYLRRNHTRDLENKSKSWDDFLTAKVVADVRKHFAKK